MKLQSVLYYYFLDLLKAGDKKNIAVFSEYSHINQFVRPGGNYFWEYKRKFIYLFHESFFCVSQDAT